MNGTKIDDFTEQVFQDQSTNRLLIPVVTRDLWQSVVECRASSTPSIPAQIKTIALDVYREYILPILKMSNSNSAIKTVFFILKKILII